MLLKSLFSTKNKANIKKGDSPLLSHLTENQYKGTYDRNIWQSILIIVSFVIFLSIIHIVWILNVLPHHSPSIKNGEADFSNVPLHHYERISLDGEWLFYPNMRAEEVISGKGSPITMVVPGNIYKNLESSQSITYGTYRLQLHLSEDAPKLLRFYIPEPYYQAQIYINGQNITNVDQIIDDSNSEITNSAPISSSFIRNSNELDIVIGVSSSSFIHQFGLTKPVVMGEANSLIKYEQKNKMFQIITIVIFIIHAIYGTVLAIFNKQKIALLSFVIFCIFSVMTVGLDDSKLIVVLLDISSEWSSRLLALSYGICGLSIYICVHGLFNLRTRFFSISFMITLTIIMNALMFILPYPLAETVIYLEYILIVLQYSIIMTAIIRAVRERKKGSLILLTVAIVMVTTIFWGVMKNVVTPFIPYYPFDTWICFVLFTLYWIYLFFDMSENNRALAEKLLDEDLKKDQFLANTSHELRNPLQGILSMAHTSLENFTHDNDEQRKSNLQLILSIGRRMSRVLDDLLDYTRLKNNYIQVTLKPVNLYSIVSGVMDMLHYMSEEKHIQLHIDIQAHSNYVMADEQRLIQVIFNLLHNAIKFTERGSITVKASIQLDDSVLIEIIDTGVGMDEETQSKIFSPFEQAAGIYQTEGIGLGLAICDQLLKLHQSKLALTSTLGQGSTFSFTLARTEQLQAEATNIKSEKSSYQKDNLSRPYNSHESYKHILHSHELINVLVVDDDSFNLKILKKILSSSNYYIEAVHSGEAALERLEDRQWHLIISDVMMPNMSGYELTKQIRTRYSRSELPILLLTARAEPDDIFTGFVSGANDYVKKPIEPFELRSRVNALTEMQRSAQKQSRIEAAWLQAQIQPHFIFNVLNTISALSDIDQNRMKEMIEAFSSYLRLSYNVHNAQDLIPLNKELELVKAYLYIEKERFDDRLQIEWDITVDTNHLMIPPLTIQPIVENALKHGILKRNSGGTISISITEMNQYYYFSISDNGVGMAQSIVNSLNQSKAGRSGGIGVWNTNRRLKHLYGEGLFIESEIDQGTKVSFRIPRQLT